VKDVSVVHFVDAPVNCKAELIPVVCHVLRSCLGSLVCVCGENADSIRYGTLLMEHTPWFEGCQHRLPFFTPPLAAGHPATRRRDTAVAAA